jgi:hypothetical protein
MINDQRRGSPAMINLELLAHRAVSIARCARCDVRWVAAVFADLAGRKSVVPPSPPAHSSPLGLVLATLAQYILRSAARTSLCLIARCARCEHLESCTIY